MSSSDIGKNNVTKRKKIVGVENQSSFTVLHDSGLSCSTVSAWEKDLQVWLETKYSCLFFQSISFRVYVEISNYFMFHMVESIIPTKKTPKDVMLFQETQLIVHLFLNIRKMYNRNTAL